jgi:hypothetical protein
MFGIGQMTRCQVRKAALLQQSAAHRLALAREAQNLRPVAEWMDLGIDVARKARTGWNFLAPMVSLWRKPNPETSGIGQRFAGVISAARSLTALWKSWR